MTLAAIKRLFNPGQVVYVTNHYITRQEHPCFGTRERTVAKATSSHLHFEGFSGVPWPKAGSIQVDGGGAVRWMDFPNEGDLFLTIRLAPYVEPTIDEVALPLR